MGLKERALALSDEAIVLRRDFHQNPELGFEETRTARVVADYLRNLGIHVETGVGKTGVVGIWEGKGPGKTVLIRADMDALPIQEANQVSYASKNPGVMHACGHDGHTTMGLLAAKLLTGVGHTLSGRLVFVFQPAEEGRGGARAMLADGLLDKAHPDRALCVHLWNRSPVGKVAISPGPVLASADVFRIVVRGEGGHGAAPHRSSDVITAACHMVTAFQTVVSRSVNPIDTAVVSVGQFQAGEAPNVLPDHAELRGTIRTYALDVRELVIKRIQEIGQGIAASMGVRFSFELTYSTPATVNDAEVVKLVQGIAREMFGPENVVSDHRTMAS
ncbi:MAG: amidohydrolase, partial [bacterium]|nr:amidohydrolase [bacterium]